MAFGNMLPIKGCHERRVQARFPVFLNDLCAHDQEAGKALVKYLSDVMRFWRFRAFPFAMGF
jgi:hypothetical protein